MGESNVYNPHGIPIGPTSSPSTENSKALSERIRSKVRTIMKRHGVVDNKWASAISSQYFLLLIIQELELSINDDTKNSLIDRCLESFSYKHDGKFVLSTDRILITPDETKRIVDCMQKEDEETDYFSRYDHMKASNIDAELMFMNFHHALLLKLVADAKAEGIKLIRYQCLDHLNMNSSFELSGGWYSYRTPWLTARILITLKTIDLSGYTNKVSLQERIEIALESLLDRIDPKLGYWRSGVGEWVSEWESTGLCLEALLDWNYKNLKDDRLSTVVKSLTNPETCEKWLGYQGGYENEETANALLASVVLSSVMCRLLGKVPHEAQLEEIQLKTLTFIEGVLDKLLVNPITKNRQFCTIPQLLHYALRATRREDS